MGRPMKAMPYEAALGMMNDRIAWNAEREYVGLLGNTHVFAIAEDTTAGRLVYIGPRGGYDTLRIDAASLAAMTAVLARRQRP